MRVGLKLRKAREARARSQSYAAKVAGVVKPTYQKWESTSEPPREKVERLASDYRIYLDWFYNKRDDDVPEPYDESPVVRMLPNSVDAMIGTGSTVSVRVWRGAGMALANVESWFEDADEEEEVPAFLIGHKPFKAEHWRLMVPTGISMMPRISPGDRVLVKLTVEVADDNLVLVSDGNGKMYIKVIRFDPAHNPELHSVSSKFPPIQDLTGWSVVGAVVSIYKPSVSEAPNFEFNFGRYLKGKK